MHRIELIIPYMKCIIAIYLLILFVALNAMNTSSLAETDERNGAEASTDIEDADKDQDKSKSNTNLKEILEKHYQAIGGSEAWEKVETLKFTGIMNTQDAIFRTAAVYKRPDYCRLDFQTGGLYFIESYDGKIPWQMSPGAGIATPKILKGKRAKEMIDTCDFEGPLVEHDSKGHLIKYLGTKELDGSSVYMLEITHKSGNVDTYYLDTETYLPNVVKRNTIIQGKEVKTTINISDYIEIDEIKIPFNYEFIVDGNQKAESLKVQTVEINAEVDDDIFKLPKRQSDLR